MKKIFEISILFVTCVSFFGCGTDTGNPLTKKLTSEEIQSLASGAIMIEVCTKIASCHLSAEVSNCVDRFSLLQDAHPNLGLPLEQFKFYWEVIQAEKEKSLSPNDDAAHSCLNAISSLSCQDSRVVNGVRDPKGLLISPCNQVF